MHIDRTVGFADWPQTEVVGPTDQHPIEPVHDGLRILPDFVASGFVADRSTDALQSFLRGLLSVHSRYGLHARGVAKRPFPSKAPTALLPPLPLRLLPGGANQFPGGSCTRCSRAPFTAHCFANDKHQSASSG